METMEEMVSRLYGTGGGEQAKAVVNSIKLINATTGALDAGNRVVALWHMAVALSPDEFYAAEAIMGLAEWIKEEQAD